MNGFAVIEKEVSKQGGHNKKMSGEGLCKRQGASPGWFKEQVKYLIKMSVGHKFEDLIKNDWVYLLNKKWLHYKKGRLQGKSVEDYLTPLS